MDIAQRLQFLKSINNIARHTKDGIVYDKTGAKASGD